ncbi:MAG: DegV family protein [Anaerolineae bacterium]|nr:DegV family protein [Anaerolineae bacterium]
MAAQRVGIVADSTSDLPQAWLDKWGVIVVPAFINWGTDSYADDGVQITKPEFYRRLATSPDTPRTSAMPPGLALDAIRKQLANHEQVVVFSLASQFSSIYNTFVLVAQQIDPDRVTVYDSGSVSLGLGWQLAAGAEVAATGGSVQDILQAARETRKRVKLFAMIDTLEFLRRGGRVSNVVAGIGTLLQIKPIIDVYEGNVTTVQRQRTSSRALQALIETVLSYAPFERLGILHTANESGAEALKAKLSAVASGDILITEATPGIGVHTGPGCLGVSFVKQA